jgi:hypothetical protein
VAQLGQPPNPRKLMQKKVGLSTKIITGQSGFWIPPVAARPLVEATFARQIATFRQYGQY